MATKPTRATRPNKTRPGREDKKPHKKAQEDDDDEDDDEDDEPQKKSSKQPLVPKGPAPFKPKLGKGFRVTVEMPFRAKDLFRELCKPEEPLGFDKETATVSVVRPGTVRDQVFSVGFVRKSVFKNRLLGNTSSQLVELENDGKGKMKMSWKVLSADMPLAIRGTKAPPICSIELKQQKTWSGSTMSISWDYEYVHCLSPCCCLAPCAPCVMEGMVKRSLNSPDNVFQGQMVDRGYPDMSEAGATRLQALAKAFAVRRAEARLKAKKPVYDNDDDDDDDKKSKTRGKRGAVGGPGAAASRPQRARPPSQPAAATSSKPSRDPAASVSRPTRPARGVQFGSEEEKKKAEAAAAAAASSAPKSTVKVIDDDDAPSTLKVIDDDD